MLKLLTAASATALFMGLGATAQAAEQTITITLENIIKPGVQYANNPSPLTPAVYVVHTGDNPIFTAGEKDRGEGLEVLAEDGATRKLVASLKGKKGIVEVGVLDGGLLRAGGKGTAQAKFEAFREAGIMVSESPAGLGETMLKAMGR